MAFAIATAQPNAVLVDSNVRLDDAEKPQFINPFKYPRYFSFNDVTNSQGYVIDPIATEYFNNPNYLVRILDVYYKYSNLVGVGRIHREDSSLYEQSEGTRIAEEITKKMPSHDASMSELKKNLSNQAVKAKVENDSKITMKEQANNNKPIEIKIDNVNDLD